MRLQSKTYLLNSIVTVLLLVSACQTTPGSTNSSNSSATCSGSQKCPYISIQKGSKEQSVALLCAGACKTFKLLYICDDQVTAVSSNACMKYETDAYSLHFSTITADKSPGVCSETKGKACVMISND